MIIAPGSTSVIKHVFIQDSTVSTGAGKTALAYTDITAYYVRAGGTLTALTLETIATLGTWASTGDNYLGFKKLDDTNAPGLYELDLPNNILASGSSQVTIQLTATGAFCAPIEIDLGKGVADAFLDRDMSLGPDSGTATVRTPRQALRFLRNKWTVSAGSLSVRKEDDSTESWAGTITADAAAQPIVGCDPASS